MLSLAFHHGTPQAASVLVEKARLKRDRNGKNSARVMAFSWTLQSTFSLKSHQRKAGLAPLSNFE
jgi:hypothetical protein